MEKFSEKFSHIDTWVFDLDNTLYDAEAHVFVECGRRMTDFVARHLGLEHEQAAKIRKDYYLKYGTTLRGLMTEHGVPPDDFLEEVHSIDISPVEVCTLTRDNLSRLPGRKFVFTNAPRGFAERMTEHLCIRNHFDAIFAIEDADYWPKPHMPTYEIFLKKFGIDPTAACMFEDMQVNLKPAHDLGMTTVWFHGSDTPPDHPHVHHQSEKLSRWISENLHK